MEVKIEKGRWIGIKISVYFENEINIRMLRKWVCLLLVFVKSL